MRAIHVSVRVAPVRGALNHGDHGNCAYQCSSFVHSYVRLIEGILFSIEGLDVCKVRRTGQLKSFSGTKINVKLPCKYEATNMKCEVGVLELSIG